MASGGQAPGQNRLVLDGEVFDDGAVGVAIGGEVRVRIGGQPGLPADRPADDRHQGRAEPDPRAGPPAGLEVLRELFEELPTDDQERVQSGLHIGRVINEYQESFRRGDFLVRNVMGADDAGGIAITDLVRVGQTVQFHVRDAETADEDLGRPDRPSASAAPSQVAGALLFTCNGRGTRLFPDPDHDVARPPRTARPDPRRRLLRHGRDRPRRRPELRPRLHRERRPVSGGRGDTLRR